MKKAIFLAAIIGLSNSSLANNIEAGVDAQPRDSTCAIHSPCLVSTSHWGNVINRNQFPITTFIVYKICPQNENCKLDRYKVTVQPGTWADGKIETLQAKYHQRGQFFLEASTTIYDEAGNVLANMTKRGKTLVR